MMSKILHSLMSLTPQYYCKYMQYAINEIGNRREKRDLTSFLVILLGQLASFNSNNYSFIFYHTEYSFQRSVNVNELNYKEFHYIFEHPIHSGIEEII